jgi:uncharacterized protein YjbJ (UPF0337 family)
MAGQFDKVKGRAKEAAGDLKGDKSLQNEGKADRAAGSIKETAEKAKDKVGDVVDKVRGKATK